MSGQKPKFAWIGKEERPRPEPVVLLDFVSNVIWRKKLQRQK
jgi:hypothetical protein